MASCQVSRRRGAKLPSETAKVDESATTPTGITSTGGLRVWNFQRGIKLQVLALMSVPWKAWRKVFKEMRASTRRSMVN